MPYFSSVFLLFFEPEAPVPPRVASQPWSALLPPTATTTTVRRQGHLLLVTGHVAHGRHLRTTCRRRCSPEHAPRLGFLVTPVPRQLLHSSSAADRPKPHPPDSNAPRSASMLHPTSLARHNYLHSSASSQHKTQDRLSTCTFSALRGPEASAHTKDKHTGINTFEC